MPRVPGRFLNNALIKLVDSSMPEYVEIIRRGTLFRKAANATPSRVELARDD